MSNKKVQINICSYDEMLQIPTIGRARAIQIWELRRVRTITPELLATIPYIKMEVVNQYIDYTSLDEFEFEDQDQLDYCKPTYFRGYYVSRFSDSRQFRGDLISR